jgi:hypothetical protein
VTPRDSLSFVQVSSSAQSLIANLTPIMDVSSNASSTLSTSRNMEDGSEDVPHRILVIGASYGGISAILNLLDLADGKGRPVADNYPQFAGETVQTTHGDHRHRRTRWIRFVRLVQGPPILALTKSKFTPWAFRLRTLRSSIRGRVGSGLRG